MLDFKWYHWMFIAVYTGVGFIYGAFVAQTISDTLLSTSLMLIASYIGMAIIVLTWRTGMSLLRGLTSRLIVEPDER